jgi:osmotically inducible lipoprotein OsmB
MEKSMKQIAKTAALAVGLLSFGAVAANADCHARKTTGTVLGAAGGGVLGNVITHGSVIGTIGGAVVGGVAGHEIGRSGCTHVAYYHHRRYYVDRNGHRHYYRVATR